MQETLAKLQLNIEQYKWLEISELLEEFLEGLSSKGGINVALYLAYQFLPVFEYYVAQSDWCRTVLTRIRKNQNLDNIVFSEIDISFSNYDLEIAIESYRDGIVFLSYASESENDKDIYSRKLSLALSALVSAITSEFEATHFPRKWGIMRNEDGVLERKVSIRSDEVERFKASIWRNIAELLFDN